MPCLLNQAPALRVGPISHLWSHAAFTLWQHRLTLAFAKTHGAPDVVITDPPRAGMHADVVAMLIELQAPRLVYVSCNPATQARDLKLLVEGGYTLERARPVDMFPQTPHCEAVAVLVWEKG